MNLQQLYYFQEIYKNQSYTKASKNLNVAQSSLSHSISDLESELKVPLFQKSGRNIVPTKYADKMYGHVDNILNEIQTIRDEIQEELDPQAGIIRVGMSPTLSVSFMPQLIRNYYKHVGSGSRVYLVLESMTAAIVNEELKAHRIDIGFGAKIEDKDLGFYQISSDEIAVIVPRDHRLAREKQIPFCELEGEPLITYPYTCGTRYYVDSLLQKHGVNPGPITEVATENLMGSLVSAGRGVAIIAVLPDLANYDVVRVDLEGGPFRRPLYMEWLNAEFMKPSVRQLRDFVIREMEEKENK